MRLFIVFMQILLCCGKHKFDPVQLIYFAGTWIVVDGNNVGFRMLTANFLDDTFSYDVVRQASKGWMQTMFGIPPWMSSIISPVRNHPSPV